MKIKKGDKVKILSGKDKGKSGKVLQVFPAYNKISIEGLNLSIKHLRPRKQGEGGQRIEFPAPFAIAKVALLCPKCDRSTRVGYKYLKLTINSKEKIKKIRICKKCLQEMD